MTAVRKGLNWENGMDSGEEVAFQQQYQRAIIGLGIIPVSQEMQKENCTLSSNCLSVGNYTFDTRHLEGQGATGKVYRGQHSSSGTPVAIKHIDVTTLCDDATRTLLRNEIKALRMVSHPNVLHLQDVIEAQGNVYIVTELIKGGTLKVYLAHRGPLQEAEAMALFRDILAGCRAISEAGIIHRDLKPGNIMLAGKVSKIIDFGFCEVILGGGIVRAFNVGSPAYMAPEALLKTLFSEKSDSWSLGIILYEMLHGETPDRGTDIREFLEQAKTSPDLIKSRMRTDLSCNVREILLKSLQFKSEERISISGMKYLADVYMISHNKKGQTGEPPISRQPLANQAWKNNQASTASEAKNTILAFNPEQKRQGQAQHFTQIPSQAKENQRESQSVSQFFRPPQAVKPRCQPPADNFQSLPSPNGFISYSQFTRDSVLRREISGSRASNMSMKVKNENSSFIGGGWKKAPWREGMERPLGQPVYREVRVRYL